MVQVFFVKGELVQRLQCFQKAHRIFNIMKIIIILNEKTSQTSILKKLNKIIKKNEYYFYL